MPNKKVKPAVAWYEDPDKAPIYEMGDGQEIIQVLSRVVPNAMGNLIWEYAIIKMDDDGTVREVIELENGWANVVKFDN